MPNLILTLLAALALYLAAGVVFAIPFVIRGVTRIDPAAAGSSWRFRLLILPGVAALWPVLLATSRRARSAPDSATPHAAPTHQ